VRIKFWGVRGSIPAPLDTEGLRRKLTGALEFARDTWKKDRSVSVSDIVQSLPDQYGRVVGGDTTCIEVNYKEHRVVIDLGTGSRKLGYQIMKDMPGGGDIYVLMTHTHWDHVQGLPFFLPVYIPKYHLHFYSALPDLEKRLKLQQKFDYFPVKFEQTGSKKTFHNFNCGDRFTINGMNISTAALIHPGGSVAYRIEAGNKSFIMSTDTEFFGARLDELVEHYRPFYNKADMVVLDAQYSLLEAEEKVGWGHTAMFTAIDCAVNWGVKKLVLTHHEPSHPEEQTHQLYADAMSYFNSTYRNRSKMKIVLAQEQTEFKL
jgi:phosphoribosyl 1,2-cyclic phosphodiesterase